MPIIDVVRSAARQHTLRVLAKVVAKAQRTCGFKCDRKSRVRCREGATDLRI